MRFLQELTTEDTESTEFFHLDMLRVFQAALIKEKNKFSSLSRAFCNKRELPRT